MHCAMNCESTVTAKERLKSLSGEKLVMIKYISKYHQLYQNITLWHSTLWKNPTKITVAQKFKNRIKQLIFPSIIKLRVLKDLETKLNE